MRRLAQGIRRPAAIALGIACQLGQGPTSIDAKTLGMGQPRALRREIRQLVDIQLGLVDLLDLEREEVLPLGSIALLGQQLLDRLIDGAQGPVGLRDLQAQRQQVALAIEHLPVGLLSQQRLGIVLT